MKHLHTFESFLNESLTESVGYSLKDDSGQGRPTMVLKLDPEAWELVKNLFDTTGRPVSDEIMKIPSQNTVWTLHAQEYPQGGKVMHRIYGVSGDYTFGNAPTYYQQKLRGNKNAAKEVLTLFVDKYLK
jgi:hypothetical protein